MVRLRRHSDRAKRLRCHFDRRREAPKWRNLTTFRLDAIISVRERGRRLSPRWSLPDSPLRGLYGSLPWTSARCAFRAILSFRAKPRNLSCAYTSVSRLLHDSASHRKRYLSPDRACGTITALFHGYRYLVVYAILLVKGFLIDAFKNGDYVIRRNACINHCGKESDHARRFLLASNAHAVVIAVCELLL